MIQEEAGSSVRAPAGLGAVLPLLFFGYLLSYADRFVFGMVLKPIQQYLHLSDSAAGLLAGFAFASTYAVFSPAAGYFVDRVSRKAVFLAAVTVWSAATFACGLADTPLRMGMARAAVGVGEALMIPLAVSLIGDTVTMARRARAMASFFTAGPIGSLAVLLLGGLLLRRLSLRPIHLPLLGLVAPWQSLFLMLAGPGLLLFTCVVLLMREPARQAQPAAASKQGAPAAQLSAVWSFVRANPRLCTALFAGFPLLQIGGVAVAVWAFVYFDRVYRLPLEKAAVAFSLSAGLTTIAGCLLSGRLVTWFRQRGYADASLRACLAGGLGFAFFATLGLLASGPMVALVFFAAAFFFSYLPTIGAFSAVSEAAPAAIRASVAGVNTLMVGLITTSLGPLLVGALSDHLFPGRFGLRWAMLLTVAGSTLAGGVLVFAGLRPLRLRLGSLEALIAEPQAVEAEVELA